MKKSRSKINELYDKHSQGLRRFIGRYVRDEHEVNSIVNDTFVKVYQNIEEYDKNKAKLSTWIYFIAKNIMVDNARKENAKRKVKIVNCIEFDTNKACEYHNNFGKFGLFQDEYLMFVSSCVSREDFVIYFMKYVFGFTNHKIAVALDISETNVKVKVHRIKERLESNKNKMYEVIAN